VKVSFSRKDYDLPQKSPSTRASVYRIFRHRGIPRLGGDNIGSSIGFGETILSVTVKFCVKICSCLAQTEHVRLLSNNSSRVCSSPLEVGAQLVRFL
jgi:hypothetical protein